MLEDIRKKSDIEKYYAVIKGVSLAEMVAYDDMDRYIKHEQKLYEPKSEKEEIDFYLMDELKKLGYPIDELGTYLYKDLIEEMYEELKTLDSEAKEKRIEELKEELEDDYSQIYHTIAREDKEMGVKLFHKCIREAVEKAETRKYGKQALIYREKALDYASLLAKLYRIYKVKQLEK